MPGEADRDLRRFERDAVLACGAMAAVGLAASGGRWDAAAGVLAGGLLMAVCYGAVKGGVDALLGRRDGARRRVRGAVKFFTRYALLAVGAYVMLTCFRLHPIGLLAGAASPFVAALAQVVRMSRSLSRREHPL